MDIFDVTTGALVVLALFDWVTTAILLRTARAQRAMGHRVKTLEDRGRVATAIAAAATLGAILGINRHLSLGIPPAVGVLMLVILVMLPSLANLWFLIDLWRGEFGE